MLALIGRKRQRGFAQARDFHDRIHSCDRIANWPRDGKRSWKRADADLLNVEPTVGSTPPWAGVTPAPGIRKEKMRDFVPVRTSEGARPGIDRKFFFNRAAAEHSKPKIKCVSALRVARAACERTWLEALENGERDFERSLSVEGV